MGAIFGFLGSRDDGLLDRIASVSTHRGRYGEERECRAEGSMAHRALTQQVASPDRRRGLLTRGHTTIALAGVVVGEGDEPLSLGELLRRFSIQGPDFVASVRGAFVMAILDRNALHLFRDGAGHRTVYYGRHEGRFHFAVEPKGVLAAPGFPRRILPAGVARFLTFSFQPLGETMLEGLFELPAGCRLEVVAGEQHPAVTRWFRFEEVPPEGQERSDAAWVRELRDTHEQAVAERLPTNEPVGVFLSGGVDSSAVTAAVARQSPKPVRTWAIHFGPEYHHELDFARAVAERCGTEHTEVLIRPQDFVPRLREAIWHLDDPIGDPVTIPNFELAKIASREARMIFNGEGGDPCLGGPKNIPMMLHHWYGVPQEPRFRERRYLASYRRAYEELDLILTPELRAQIDPERDLECLLSPFFETKRPARMLDKLTAINIRLKGAHMILPKVERMMAASGVTPLSPLFDDRIVRLALRLPPHLRLAGGIEKIALKRAYEHELPASVIERPKSGMRVPVHWWLQGEMKKVVEKILAPKAIRSAGIFDPERVQQLLAYDVAEGRGRYGLRLWMLTTFELWRRIVVEREPV